MSLVPAFEIGVWNAWIFMAYLLLSIIPFMYVAIKKDSPSVKETGLSRVSMMFATSSKLFLLPAMIYSLFLPLRLGTVWFYVGLPVTLTGLIGYTLVLINWATTPLDNQISRVYIGIHDIRCTLLCSSSCWVWALLPPPGSYCYFSSYSWWAALFIPELRSRAA